MIDEKGRGVPGTPFGRRRPIVVRPQSQDAGTEPVPLSRLGDDAAAAAFAADLRQRGLAARGLERDLIQEVPLLYGSSGRLEPQGDPGIVLAAMHRDDMVRRNGGGIPVATRRARAFLPYEREMAGLSLLFVILYWFGVLD
ncbi:hypothetical protein [Sphingomonas prati]|uniref:Uncharacterized protein n=1 Tax=Sphingomonas prati TaxID=1843237 RepID=A0A7W9BRS9_9SPHN|nr:hypothetical protein [Sphingomonas prati]MBB5728910.1 hypothetical protein [Sphingomonas prati]GGE86590.1 hypothetical protein GCM10011404_19200 [Sphingomonas prati]